MILREFLPWGLLVLVLFILLTPLTLNHVLTSLIWLYNGAEWLFLTILNLLKIGIVNG